MNLPYKYLLGCVLTVLTTTTFAASCQLPEFKGINKQSKAMERCWNSGDLTCVVNKFYDKDFVYVGDKIIRSKAELYEHYQRSFRDGPKTPIAKLKYELLDCKALGSDYVSSLGQYTVNEKDKLSQGYDILLWHKVNGEYKIITDMPKPSKTAS